MSNAGSKEGIRKDSISHGIRSAIMEMGGYPQYFLDMRKKLPTKFADMVSKYIPQEIEQTTNVQHNVLVVNMPEPRQLNTPEPVQVLGCVDTIESSTANPRKPAVDVNECETMENDTDE